MAQRRMLSKRISQSKKVNSLPLKAQLVYTWTIPWLDDYGCYTGDSEDIKTEVFPKNRKITRKDIESALGKAAELGLIFWYSIGNGEIVQQYQNFDSFQTFKSDRPRVSEYPQFQAKNEDMVPVGNQKVPEGSLKLSKDKLSKDKEKYMDFVFLSKDEYSKLVEKFSKAAVDSKIEDLNDYIGQKGRKYKSHYYTLNKWLRKEQKENPPKKCIKCSKLGVYTDRDDTGQIYWLCETHKPKPKPLPTKTPQLKQVPKAKINVSDEVNRQKNKLGIR